MKKVMIFAVVAVFLLGGFSFSGCTAIKAANQAKEMLAQYYDYYNDEDIDECIDMFGDEIIEDIGDDDLTEIVFNSRRYLLGEIEEYDIVSFDSDSSFKEAQVVLEAEVQYKNEDEIIEEEYIFYLNDGKMEIAGIDIPDSPVADDLIDNYFDKYYDTQHVMKYYIPYVVDNYFDEDGVGHQADYAKEAGGEYIGNEITNITYYFDELSSWSDDIYYLAQIDAELEFENENFILYAEISSEDGDVAFNYLEYYPIKAYQVLKEYYDSLSKADTNKIIGMYASKFFEYSDMSSEDWESSILQVLTNNYGNFIDYYISEWEYSVVTLDDGDVEVYSFTVTSEFESAYFDEYITIIRDKTSEAIIGHQISIQ